MADNKDKSWYEQVIFSAMNKKWIAIPLLGILVYLGVSNIFKTTVENMENANKIKELVKQDSIINPKPLIKTTTEKAQIQIESKKDKIKYPKAEQLGNENSMPPKAKQKEAEHGESPYYEATGVCVINKDLPNRVQAIELAKVGAITVAKSKLLEKIKGAYLKNEIEVENLSNATSKLTSKIEGVIYGSEVVGEPIVDSEKVEVKIRLNKDKVAKSIN